MNEAHREFALMNGFSPLAEGVLLIDYDGTLFPFGELLGEEPPLPGAVEAMKRLESSGYSLRIFSSRLADSWLDAAEENLSVHLRHMSRMLDRYDIPYHGFSSQKDPAQYYIDDRAITFKNNWNEIADRLVQEATSGS